MTQFKYYRYSDNGIVVNYRWSKTTGLEYQFDATQWCESIYDTVEHMGEEARASGGKLEQVKGPK
jgi:hypothetical protein